jgi:hypothetical protein
MPLNDAHYWSERVRRVLERYEEPLLRQVAGRLFKPRSHWPAEELLERSLATLGNVAVIDRRIRALQPAAKKILTLMGHSRQPRWAMGSLLELLAALGHAEGPAPILALFAEGLLYPDLDERSHRLKSFETWLGSSLELQVFAYPQVTARALGEDLGLPSCPGVVTECTNPREADGLEWLLRLAALWQQVMADPLRQTQQGDFFKRDLDRLQNDPLLAAPPADALVPLPDLGLLTAALAESGGILQRVDGDLHGGSLPDIWEDGLFPALASMLAWLFPVQPWNPETGWLANRTAGNPYPSAFLLALLLLTRLADQNWAVPEAIATWIFQHHPYWHGSEKRAVTPAIQTFLLGLAYPLRMIQAAKDGQGEWVVRLSELGRWVLGVGSAPTEPPKFPKTLLVQPNLEIIAYRQGLTPALIASLSRFAAWKNLGSACTLQLQPETAYRALEGGLTLEAILQTLDGHGMHATPTAVVESLRTWANKRERLSVYPSAALFEFASAADLEEALARGLPAVRLSDRLAVVANEGLIDYRHFRLTGTRDYGLPPDQCVEVESDGVTLTVDSTRSDLLLETELRRFADWMERPGANGRRQYRLTPETLSKGQETGMGLLALEEWFRERTGKPMTPAVRLLLTAAQAPPPELQRQLVLHVASSELADGLMQWPATRGLIHDRLGPTTLAVDEDNVDPLRSKLRELGIALQVLDLQGQS